MNPQHEKALEYIYNTGGSPSIKEFVEDHEPIGQLLIVQMEREGLIAIVQGKIINIDGDVKISAKLFKQLSDISLAANEVCEEDFNSEEINKKLLILAGLL